MCIFVDKLKCIDLETIFFLLNTMQRTVFVNIHHFTILESKKKVGKHMNRLD